MNELHDRHGVTVLLSDAHVEERVFVGQLASREVRRAVSFGPCKAAVVDNGNAHGRNVVERQPVGNRSMIGWDSRRIRWGDKVLLDVSNASRLEHIDVVVSTRGEKRQREAEKVPHGQRIRGKD